MKKIYLQLFLSTIGFFSLSAQNSGWQWAKGLGFSGNDNGNGIATDSRGNCYFTGSAYITSDDIIITKTNSAGTAKWTKLINGGGYETGKKIKVDKHGNVYVMGQFSSSQIVFGSDTLHHVGNKDIFIVKYDSSGNELWATTPIGTANTDEDVNEMCIDTSGNVLITGFFTNDLLTFGTYTLSTPSGYVAKYDPNGNVLWAKSVMGAGNTCISTDAAGNVFTGGFFGTAITTCGSISLNNSDPWGGSWDMFVFKLGPNGNTLWGRSAGSFQEYDQAQAIAADSAGNVFVTGAYQSPGISFGAYSLNNNGAQEYFIVKYDAIGNVLWAQSAGGNNWDSGIGITTDKKGNAIVTGAFSTNITFGVFTLANTQPGTYDVFMVKYDPSGYVLWAKSFGGNNSDMPSDIAVSGDRNVYVCGNFVSASITFPGASTLTNNGASDLFFAKYTPCSDNNYVPICMVTVDSLSQNNLIYWDKSSLTSSVDSFIVYREVQSNLYLPIGAVPFDSLSQFVDTARTKYFANYFSTGDPNSGTYRYKIAIRDTCGNISEMSGYHNTIFMINNNGTFSWPQLYNIEGSANPVGSYVLYRDDNNTGNWHGVNSVTGSQQTITDPNYLAYQNTANWQIRTLWSIACTPTQRISNPNSDESTIVKSKSNITNNRAVGIGGVNAPRIITMYPNPSEGIFTLSSGATLGNVQVINALGEKVYQSFTKERTLQIDLQEYAAGVYFVQVQAQVLKLVKK
jgi:hypothetical protein